MSEETIRHAFEKISDPEVYSRLAYASTPEARRVFIESLPGIEELVLEGSEAESAILRFFQSDETRQNDALTGIALYLLQRLPSDDAARPLAEYLTSGNISSFNSDLAVQAFLSNAGIDIIDEDPKTVAFREAVNYLNR